MARRSQCSSQGDNPLDPNYLPPHYKEYYRVAIDMLAEEGVESYSRFLTNEGFPDFLCSTEVDHIGKRLQRPPAATQDSGSQETSYSTEQDADGSSGTYWPMHSDTAAPELDLGWPMVLGFQGTEVTTLIHPPPPDNPSIKEEVRRMIRSAQQVIAIVMDIFTDVDILSELLDAAARRVPVYILLDEVNSHYFLDMAAKCRVNLNYVEFFRVRTVMGSTYFCRTGASFKGNLMEKFLLVDCTMVLSGNYSFMWSFEKIHRSMAHIFQGELVASFDEEFRILFAQSDPLIPAQNALVKVDNPYTVAPYGGARPFYQRKLQMMFPKDDGSQNSYNSYDRMDPEKVFLQSFRRDDVLRHTMEGSGMRQMIAKKMAQQMEMERTQMEQKRALMFSKQLEMDAFKRHSFAEGTYENYMASKQYSKQMFVNNDDYRFQASHFQKEQTFQTERMFGANRPQGLFERIRAARQGFQELEGFGNDPRYTPNALPIESNYQQEGYSQRLNYVPSGSSREVRYGSDQVNLAGDGILGQRSQKRQNIGQKFICQTSPTQKQNLEQRLFLQDQDTDKKPQQNKQGLRNWRISSYLSAYQSEQGEEGLPVPIDTEICDDVLVPMEKEVVPSEPLPKNSNDPIPSYKLTGPFNNSALAPEQFKETTSTDKDSESNSLVRQDSFRSRINPLIQRSSRLRSSLIFSSSKVEQHNSASDTLQLFQKEQATSEVTSENDGGRTSSTKVADLLERYKTVGKDSETTAMSHTKAVSSFLQEDSQSTQKKSTETMTFKAMESKVLDTKESFARTLLNSQYSKSTVSSQFEALLNQGIMSSKMEKVETQFQIKEASNLALPDATKSSLLETTKPALPEPQESQISLGGNSDSLKTPQETKKPYSALVFGNALESLARSPESSSFLTKTDAESSTKSDQPTREFFRKGSLKLKQLLNTKVEKKAEEETVQDSAKIEKQNTALRQLSKGDVHEVTSVANSEEMSYKTAPASKTIQPSQSRLSSSTSNVLYSSNLRDDTKVILEQISANSQKNRAELLKQAQQVTSTNDLENKGEETPEQGQIPSSESFTSQNRFLKPSQASSEDRETLLKKMENMRKEKRVYSRFEVFCKKDEQPSQGEAEGDGDAKDRKLGKIMPKILGSFKTKK
uniref:Protein FAM83H n=1 Tax=Geotrypetes seraphini TaxID=260995 RepID=A0A6P8QR07_GEOSA|nr:protein FAM83H [Geotrypetes seraphini]XP_033788992.1 protein FAM83H [Geotrypetes seraphini]XP_033788993.1 protein FAM83H [Geotrypetes seraphini]XP_033788994.1 protein FAM83H [Geotrypetes seraphini]XP_033788995.1 protein FAM83H [Geotrypetes seraphini]XP_033788996.1 protein FAM83H [Geotrypetes seraphini]XP_033788997.1 protein FAM83H [Geotrypetes seraphini]